MLTIPKPILDMLGLRANSEVRMTVTEGKLILEPKARPTYTLSEPLGQCDSSALAPVEERDWLDDKPAGREAI